MAIKITGVITITAATSFTIELTSGGGTGAKTVTLTTGDYFVRGNGTAADLLQNIKAAIAAEASGESASFDFELSSAGLVGFKMGAGETATLVWDSTSAYVQDWLRLNAHATDTLLTDTVAGGTNSEGGRTHKSGFYPALTAVHDLRQVEALKTVATSDTGVTNTVHYGARTLHNLTIQATASNPYDTSFTEYSALEDAMVSHWLQGKRLEFYRDSTVTTAYAHKTNPLGYLTLVVVAPSTWDPQTLLVRQDWYSEFRLPLLCREYV